MNNTKLLCNFDVGADDTVRPRNNCIRVWATSGRPCFEGDTIELTILYNLHKKCYNISYNLVIAQPSIKNIRGSAIPP